MNEKYVEIVGLISGSLSASAFFPQVYYVIKNNSTEGLSAKTYFIYTLSLVGWIFYGRYKPDNLIILFNVITLSLTLIVDGYFIKSLLIK